MRNLRLLKATSLPNAFSKFELESNGLNNNYLIKSRDGKGFVAVTYETIKDPSGRQDKKCVHLCNRFIKDDIDPSDLKKAAKPISIIDIVHDAEEEELESLINSPPVGVVYGFEDDDADDFGESIDPDYVTTIVIGIRSGHLIKIRLTTHNIGRNELLSNNDDTVIKPSATIIGTFDDGLVAISRSQDEELVVAISDGLQGKGQQVIIMSAEFDLLLERPLDPDFDGTEKSVNVGWGAKETQFHGKAGKLAAKTKADLTSSGLLDDRQVNIVWREDCQYFAISHLSKCTTNDETSQLRRIRIFDRDGTLLHTSEPVGGLESGAPLAWKPSGSLIAATVRKPNGKYVVCFFEKNGLMHGEFELRIPGKSKSSQIAVTNLQWNKDSTVLMVVSKDVMISNDDMNSNGEFGQHHIQLWTSSNYRWHLKQCLTFQSPIVFQEWAMSLPDGSQHPLVFNVATADGCFRSYRYGWRIDSSGEVLYDSSLNTVHDNDLANVAVIDGCILKLTPFSQTVIPPPISAYEIHFQHEIRQIIFPTSSPRNRNKILIITCNNDLIVCKRRRNMRTSVETQIDRISSDVKVTGSGGQGFLLKCDVLEPEQTMYKICDSVLDNEPPKQYSDEISNYCFLATNSCHGKSNYASNSLIAASGSKLFVFELPSKSFIDDVANISINSPPNSNVAESLKLEKCILKSTHVCESPIFNISSFASHSANNLSSQSDIDNQFYDSDEAVIQLDNGKILIYRPGYDNLVPYLIDGKELRLAAKCVKLTVLHCLNYGVSTNEPGYSRKLLSYSEKNRLYLDGFEIATGVTSYFVHTNFLLITTLQHSLRSLPLHALFEREITNETKNELWITESTRSLERGSRIVVAVPPPDTKVVLQMPRGNLEVINPRPLALQIVKTLLDECKFKHAMDIFRRQRINQNLIVDHNPAHFIKNVRDFVLQVSSQGIQRLCLFIADLMEEDCTTTMFQSMYTTVSNHKLGSKAIDENIVRSFWTMEKSSKISTVCSSLLDVFNDDHEKFFLPIISCLVKRSSTSSKSILTQEGSDGVEESLLRIQKMRCSNPKLAEEGLSFLSLLAVGEGGGGDRLFDAALGVYDFDLVLFVAEKSSQKDPKEYLPFLNELKMLSQGEEYRKFRIDIHLKRYRSALKHIVNNIIEMTSSDSDDQQMTTAQVNELLNLVKDQRLFSDALGMLKITQSSPINLVQIHSRLAISYADYLLSKRYYEDAALMYELGKDESNAIHAWEKSGNWSYCIALASNEKSMKSSDFEGLCRRLVERLKDEKRHTEAALILTEHLDECGEEAVEILTEGHCWHEAYRLAARLGRMDLCETHLKPCIIEATDITLSNVKNAEEKFTNQVTRLEVVLKTRNLNHLDNDGDGEGVLEHDLENMDLYSDTTSQFSGRTSNVGKGAKTNPLSIQTKASSSRTKSSKNRRKSERKKYSTKEGGLHEDIGLIASLHQLITDVYNSTIPEVSDLIRALMRIPGQYQNAKDIQEVTIAFLDKISVKEDVIWLNSRKENIEEEELNNVRYGPNATTAEIISQQKESKTTSNYVPSFKLLDARLRYPPVWPTGLLFRSREDWKLQVLM